MFGHVTDLTAKSVSEAVKFGFRAWALLALAMGVIYLVVVILNKVSNKKKDENK